MPVLQLCFLFQCHPISSGTFLLPRISVADVHKITGTFIEIVLKIYITGRTYLLKIFSLDDQKSRISLSPLFSAYWISFISILPGSICLHCERFVIPLMGYLIFENTCINCVFLNFKLHWVMYKRTVDLCINLMKNR